MLVPGVDYVKIPETLEECTHIDEVHQLVTKKRGLTGIAAEIGVATGRSALPLLKMFDKVYLIDLWPHGEKDRDECLNHLKEYKDKLVVLRGLSWEMAEQIPDESLDYFFLDTDHEYESSEKELAAYYPKLRSGVGAIASGHDYSEWFPGLTQAVDEFVVSVGSPYLCKGLGNSQCWAFTKP